MKTIDIQCFRRLLVFPALINLFSVVMWDDFVYCNFDKSSYNVRISGYV